MVYRTLSVLVACTLSLFVALVPACDWWKDRPFVSVPMHEAGNVGDDAQFGSRALDGSSSDTACGPVELRAPDDPWSTRIEPLSFSDIRFPEGNSFGSLVVTGPHGLSEPYAASVRIHWGGHISRFGTVSSVETRHVAELQLALLDVDRAAQGCAHSASCRSTPASACHSPLLGWSPTIGPDLCARGRPATWSRIGNRIRVSSQFVHRNPQWMRPDCTALDCSRNEVHPVDILATMELAFVNEQVLELAIEIQSQESAEHAVVEHLLPLLSTPDISATVIDSLHGTTSIDCTGDDTNKPQPISALHRWVAIGRSTTSPLTGIASDDGPREWIATSLVGTGQATVAPVSSLALRPNRKIRTLAYLTRGSREHIKAVFEKVLSQRPPFGALDNEFASQRLTVVRGTDVNISGWVLDNGTDVSLWLAVDGVREPAPRTGNGSANVCELYPFYTGCGKAAFTVTQSTRDWDDCPHRVTVIAVDSDNNETTLGELAITATN